MPSAPLTFPFLPAGLIHVDMDVNHARGHHSIPIVQHLQGGPAVEQRLGKRVAIGRGAAQVHGGNHATPHVNCTAQSKTSGRGEHMKSGCQDGEMQQMEHWPR